MKYDPVNKVYYDHTPEEWAKLKGGYSGMSLPGSVAARLKPQERQQERDERRKCQDGLQDEQTVE